MPSQHREYDGPVDVYQLQCHISNLALDPIFDRYLRPGDAVADLGCGSGTLLHRLRDRAGALVGVDMDDAAFYKYPDLDLRKGTIYELPIESGTVDVVSSKWVFEHLAEPARAVAEIRRILKPGRGGRHRGTQRRASVDGLELGAAHPTEAACALVRGRDPGGPRPADLLSRQHRSCP